MRRFAGKRVFALLPGLILNFLAIISSAQSANPQEAQEATVSRIWFAEPGDTSLNRWDPRQLFEDAGLIKEWDGQKVVLVRQGTKREITTPGDFVVRIEPAWSNETAEQIHRLFSDRQYAAVVKQGNDAIKSGLPRWQQRVILSEMIEACSALGKPRIAGILFVSLAKENPPQLLLSTIPIPWGETALLDSNVSEVQNLSEEWIKQDSEAAQLLGAAWLLSGAKRPSAIEKLEQLAKSSKIPIVSAYAQAQLWRIVPPAEILSDRLPRWIVERDKLLLPLQAGPTMLLADRLQQAGQPNLAIPEWLRVATLHSNRYHLATKAIPKAAAALRTAKRNEEADRVQSMLDQFKTKSANSK